MINPEGQSQNGKHTLAKLAALYPLAFAMAAAANTRAGLALLGAEERESLEWAIRYVQDMNFEQLRTASHDAAWQKTAANAPIAWHDIIATLDPEARERLMEKFI